LEKHLRILPRWIIFLIDLICIYTSIHVAFLLRFNFAIPLEQYNLINEVMFIALLTHSVISLSLRTYAGIIRYTSIQDSVRILMNVGATTGIFLLIDLGYFHYRQEAFFPLSVIIINFFCAYLFLISYRLLTKRLFELFANGNAEKRDVMIYGAGVTGITTKRVLDHDATSNLRVVGFIDDNEKKYMKKLDGLYIYHPKYGLDRLQRQLKFKNLIIAADELGTDRKNEIVDWCLAKGIKILTPPPAYQWTDGEFKPQQIKDIKIEDLLNREPISIHNDVICDQVKGKVLLVTGAAGSIGSEIVRQLVKFSPELVILCDQAESPLHEIQLEIRESLPEINAVSFIADVRNKNRMRQLFELYRPEIIYHAAAYKHVPVMEDHPSEAISNNVLGTKNIADLAIYYGVKTFVFISTDKAVNPTNVMGASKRIAEIYIQSLNKYQAHSHKNLNTAAGKNGPFSPTKFITTRFGNVLGSNGSVIPRFKAQIEKGGPVTVTHAEITRYFMTIPEACQLVLEAGSMGEGGEIFVFDMGKSVKIADLAKRMISLSGFVPGKDIHIVYTGLRPGEKLYEELLNNLENTLTTYHEKIMIARVKEYDFDLVNHHITELIEFGRSYDDKKVVLKMKYIVPEYKSNNSQYAQLDTLQSDALQLEQLMLSAGTGS